MSEILEKLEAARQARAALLKKGHLEARYTVKITGVVNVAHTATNAAIDELIEDDAQFHDFSDFEWELRCALCKEWVDPGHNCVTGDINPYLIEDDETEECEDQLVLTLEGCS
jgi:hypothetical protein